VHSIAGYYISETELINVIIFGLFIPFAGTTLGAAAVFLMRNKAGERVEKILLGFASGVMLAASVWSLLLPALDMAGGGRMSFMPASVGMTVGVIFFIYADRLTHKIYSDGKRTASKTKKTAMLAFAVTLHNIPEGMAVGITLAAATGKNPTVTVASAIALAVGIAIQNIPEGAIISMPVKSDGSSKGRAFFTGVLSGAVEPIFGGLTVLVTNIIIGAMPYFLSFAAGAMIYVVARELIPDSQQGKYSSTAIAGLTLGFVTMMALDVCFS